METPLIGRYRHYKGREYMLKAVGRYEVDETEVAIYQDLEGAWWVRPLGEFAGTVEVNGEYIPRFVFLEE